LHFANGISKMQSEDIKRRINQLLIDEIEIEENQITPAANLKNDLGIDSLDFVDLFVIIENNFGFKMKAEEMADVKTIQDFYDYIIKRVQPN
jgi:acyl carrier protein